MPRTAGRFQVDHELAGIRAREKRQAQRGKQGQAGDEDRREAQHREYRPSQRHADQLVVDLQETLEPIVEPDVEALARTTGCAADAPPSPAVRRKACHGATGP